MEQRDTTDTCTTDFGTTHITDSGTTGHHGQWNNGTPQTPEQQTWYNTHHRQWYNGTPQTLVQQTSQIVVQRDTTDIGTTDITDNGTTGHHRL